jgi:hypothetical protein
MFNKKIQGVNILQKIYILYHWKVLKTELFKMLLLYQFEIMNENLNDIKKI